MSRLPREVRDLLAQLQRLRNTPAFQKQQEDLRKVADAPEMRAQRAHLEKLRSSALGRDQGEAAELAEQMRHAGVIPDLSEPLPAAPAATPKRRRKKGAGHPSTFTDEEIARAQGLLRKAAADDPKLRQPAAARAFLRTKGFKASDSTLDRRIIKQVFPSQ
jgi:hypothetical protein